MKKKVLAIMLVVTAVFFMTACKNTPKELDSSTSESEVKTQEEIASEMQAMVSEYQKNLGPAFERGTLSGYEYTNASLGIGVTLDESWEFKSQEEMNETYDSAMEYAEDDLKAANDTAMASGMAINDMDANHIETGDGLGVVAHDLGLLGNMTSARQYVEASVDSTKEMFEKIGYTDVNIQVIDETYFGQSGSSLVLSAKMPSGYILYEKNFCYKKGNVVVGIFASSVYEGRCDELLSMFYAVSAEE